MRKLDTVFNGRFFDSLQIAFPFSLFSIILYTQFCFILISFDSYHFREFFIYLIWLPICFIPLYLLKNKWLFFLFFFIFSILAFVELAHYILLKGPITTSSIFVLLNTNMTESSDFLKLKFNLYFFLIIPFLVLWALNFRQISRVTFNAKPNRFLIVYLVVSVIFIGENLYHGRFVRKATPHSIRAFIGFVNEFDSFNSLKNRSVVLVPGAQKRINQNQISVLIIGESLNRNHMSIYGYHRNTNPRLMNRNDLLIFSDVITPYSNTMNSVLSAISESNIDNHKDFNLSNTLIDVFHSAGFKTFWISNQSPIGIWDNAVFNIAQISDKIVFVNTSASSSFESTYSQSFDEVLFDPIISALNDKTNNKLIIIHLMGSHSDYSKRYPSEFQIFNSGLSRKNRIIDEYDNSVLYNDFFIDSVFNILSEFEQNHPNTVISALYFSDHGENVFDFNDYVGHDFVGKIPPSNVEIPFLLWISSNFSQNHPVFHSDILNNIHKPFMVDDLFHAFLNLNNVIFSGYDPKRSLFSSVYNIHRTRVLEDSNIYFLVK